MQCAKYWFTPFYKFSYCISRETY